MKAGLGGFDSYTPPPILPEPTSVLVLVFVWLDKKLNNCFLAHKSRLSPASKMRLLLFAPKDSIHTKRWISHFSTLHEVFLADELSQTLSPSEIVQIINPDIVHGHSITGWGWQAAATAFHPLVLSAWGSDLLLDVLDINNLLLTEQALRNADLVTADSEELLEKALELGAKNVKLVRFGVDLNIFNPKGDGSQIRDQLGFAAAHRIIFSPRAMMPLYNIDLLAEALPAVLETFPQARLLFNTYNQDSTYRRKIEESLLRNSVSSYARFAGG
ncbi:MAG: glycosyltransferase, partial [Blastocatellia bacterium]|nr:glycosyltransferase [Blastocatellia bacterium]